MEMGCKVPHRSRKRRGENYSKESDLEINTNTLSLFSQRLDRYVVKL